MLTRAYQALPPMGFVPKRMTFGLRHGKKNDRLAQILGKTDKKGQPKIKGLRFEEEYVDYLNEMFILSNINNAAAK